MATRNNVRAFSFSIFFVILLSQTLLIRFLEYMTQINSFQMIYTDGYGGLLSVEIGKKIR